MGPDDTIRMTLEGTHEIAQARQQLLSGEPLLVSGGALVRREHGALSPEIYVADPRSLGVLERLIGDLAPPALHDVHLRRAWRLAGRPESAWKMARLDLVLVPEVGEGDVAPHQVAFLFRLPRALEAVRALAVGGESLSVAERPVEGRNGMGARHHLVLPWSPDAGARALVAGYERGR